MQQTISQRIVLFKLNKMPFFILLNDTSDTSFSVRKRLPEKKTEEMGTSVIL